MQTTTPVEPTVTAPAELPEGTLLESVEEIRQLVAQRPPTVKEQGPASPAIPFRPVRRAPLALLCIFDDGRDDGEWVRIRNECLVIGRTEGDVVIPHETMMSGRHAEITRQFDRGRWRWQLADLNSTNGTFVRVESTLLRHGTEVQMGSNRFRFDSPRVAVAVPADAPSAETQGWQNVATSDLLPSLALVSPQGQGERFYLDKTEYWIGRNPAQCIIALPHDPLLDPQHARLYRDNHGRWLLQGARTCNGLWLRISKVPIDVGCQFQLGEQRFLLRVVV